VTSHALLRFDLPMKTHEGVKGCSLTLQNSQGLGVGSWWIGSVH